MLARAALAVAPPLVPLARRVRAALGRTGAAGISGALSSPASGPVVAAVHFVRE